MPYNESILLRGFYLECELKFLLFIENLREIYQHAPTNLTPVFKSKIFFVLVIHIIKMRERFLVIVFME